ncbi:hypothetical protein [uncultured Phenylobacterium sp.]|uniref:hypothetical protein n=1 Tax=uncultured Phenylobacterium sp. TaxID=349273 RepID=UPI0025FD5369|nr:hypothetical protein [uncultured Phenylobacterium sp.]
MRGWSWMLSGLLIWAAHFSALYAIASLDAQTSADDHTLWTSAALVATLLCLAGCGLVLARTGFGAAPALPDRLAALGSLGAAVAICWQALGALFG